MTLSKEAGTVHHSRADGFTPTSCGGLRKPCQCGSADYWADDTNVIFVQSNSLRKTYHNFLINFKPKGQSRMYNSETLWTLRPLLCYGEYTYNCKLKKIREMLLMTLAHNQHDVIDVIWRLPVWNVKIRRYLAFTSGAEGTTITNKISKVFVPKARKQSSRNGFHGNTYFLVFTKINSYSWTSCLFSTLNTIKEIHKESLKQWPFNTHPISS
jgi:hypothetical protein